ncbi:MAG: hypothetical protein SGPRY_011651, partial [Prymnesium sp.]
LRQCFPTRCDDIEAIVAMYDKDGNGMIDFNEFVEMHNELAGGATRFDEAADMFHAFDADQNGQLDRKEFEQLMHQVFPKHCDEIDQILNDEFEIADRDHSGSISFPEFCGYYDHLMDLFPDDGDEHEECEWCGVFSSPPRPLPPLISSPPSLFEDLHAELVSCVCGNTFLPKKLPVHQRGCPAFKAVADAASASLSTPSAFQTLHTSLSRSFLVLDAQEAARKEAALAKAEAAQARAEAAVAGVRKTSSRPSSGRSKSPAPYVHSPSASPCIRG